MGTCLSAKFPANREFFREFRRIAPWREHHPCGKRLRRSGFYGNFPNENSRETILENREIDTLTAKIGMKGQALGKSTMDNRGAA